MCIESESLPRSSCLKCIEKRMMAADLCKQLRLFSGRSMYFATFCHLSLFQLDNYVPIVLPAQRRSSTHTAFQPVALPSPLASTPENHIHHILLRPPQYLDPKTSSKQHDSAVTNTNRTPALSSGSGSSALPSPPFQSPLLSSLLFCAEPHTQNPPAPTDTQPTESKCLAMRRIFNN